MLTWMGGRMVGWNVPQHIRAGPCGFPHPQGWVPLALAPLRAAFRKACRLGLCNSV